MWILKICGIWILRMSTLKPFLYSAVHTKPINRCHCNLWLPGHKISTHPILCKRKPEGPWKNLSYLDSWDNPSTQENKKKTKSFGFKVFGCKVSSLDSGFITFWIRDVSRNFLYRIPVLCVNNKTNLELKRFGFVANPENFALSIT